MKQDFTTLISYLSRLFYSPEVARQLAQMADYPVAGFRFDLPIFTIWAYLIQYAERAMPDRLISLLTIATGKDQLGYNDKYLLGWLNGLLHQQAPIDPLPIPDSARRDKPSVDTLERITGLKPTLLPISFLEQGTGCARAVVRILIDGGAGTGFLVENNYIITNQHVLDSKEAAKRATIQFNYQRSWRGTNQQVETFYLDPDPIHHFTTGTDKHGEYPDDFTIVKLAGEANATYGQLQLADARPQPNQYVNIIQHPGGRPKEIALYHNVILFANDKVVQYLTDTEPGSSGSPVFNDQWEVVALHYRGGELAEPETGRKNLRNEGIAIQRVKQALQELNRYL